MKISKIPQRDNASLSHGAGNVKIKTGFRIPRLRHSRAGKCGMTDVGLIQFGARSLDFAPVLAVARTGAALGMTGSVQWWLIQHFYRRPRFASYSVTEARQCRSE
ncbi:MAG: hypothetical protein GWN55_02415 [Phycisphaerae bacterium]|nr:hypothetical protein [Phycisphaerae bacterium]NIV00186.1 hypothetical protein [Phycisphaerae bacterium]NIV69834.1 hypothetical protein [Phycisphaerae bacterium]